MREYDRPHPGNGVPLILLGGGILYAASAWNVSGCGWLALIGVLAVVMGFAYLFRRM